MTWCFPVKVPLETVLGEPAGVTGIPLIGHPGSFAYPRKHHIHEGVDLYVPSGTRVYAVEAGEIVDIQPFTGVHAGSPWWENTWAIAVHGKSGIIVYGEIRVSPYFNDLVFPWQPNIGIKRRFYTVRCGQCLGNVVSVLHHNKGRPQSMLHLELYHHDAPNIMVEWKHGQDKPVGLLDPTQYLLEAKKRLES